jgi:hypothetical protein
VLIQLIFIVFYYLGCINLIKIKEFQQLYEIETFDRQPKLKLQCLNKSFILFRVFNLLILELEQKLKLKALIKAWVLFHSLEEDLN